MTAERRSGTIVDRSGAGTAADRPALDPVRDRVIDPVFPHKASPMIVILLGAPGSGKGTQSERLTEALDLVHISSGDLFRDHLGRGTPLGELARTYMDAGALVPDEVTIRMIADRLDRPDVHGKGRVLFDGFPRTVAQADALDALLGEIGAGNVGAAVFIDVSETTVVERMAGRGRSDDNPDVIRTRLAAFRRDTEPVIGFYRAQGKLVAVDGEGTVDDVFERIMAGLVACG